MANPCIRPSRTGQYLIVDELTYHFEEPKREDVIILCYPRDPKTFFIKRIIGLPGESVRITGGKIFIINTQNPDGIQIDDSHYRR